MLMVKIGSQVDSRVSFCASCIKSTNMNEQTFPPSPNWYLNNILACSFNGTVIYGSRCNLVVLKPDIGSNEKCCSNISIISNAHKERVTAVAVSSCDDNEDKLFNCFVSAGDDYVVKVWDLSTLTPILAHISHGEGQKVCGLDWSRADSNLIVSVDESNSIICWDLSRNSTQRLFLGKLVPTCLACCPHRRNLIAIGTRSGLVCIIDIKGSGRLIYRLRGHDSEVVSLSWCPVSTNVFQLNTDSDRELAKDLLLASGSKHKSIYIWRTGTDGRYETTLSISNQLSGASSRQSVNETNWLCVYWIEAHTLLVGTKNGRLLSWDLKAHQANRVMADKSSDGSGDAPTATVCRIVHASHSRGVFCMTSFKEVGEDEGHADSENWRKQTVVWTTSQDRLLVACSLHSGEVLNTIPTIGGIVYCIAASPIDANRVAFGAGDTVIRVWDLSSPNPYEISLLWQKIKGKITTLAWHPTKENWLAFGTTEGRVGLFNISSSKQSPILFRPHHCHSLYTLCWGPPLFSKGEIEGEMELESKYALYSCGDGAIVQYNHYKPDAEPKNLKDLPQLVHPGRKKAARCDLAWKTDNSLLAIGNEDGTVQIFSVQPMVLLQTLFAHKKLIHKLVWHPEGTATDAGYSPYQHWLAVASKESIIKVYDLSELAADESNSGKVNAVATLTGHQSGVVSLCWSPHISGQLVSVSYDETAQVWDVPNQQPLGNFSLHSAILYSCVWSPLDPDLVMTGGADFTLRVWKISALPNKLPVDKKKQRKNDSKNSKPTDIAQIKSEVPVVKQDDAPVNSTVTMMDKNEQSVPMATSEKGEGRKRAVRNRSYFPVSSQMWTQGREHSLEHCRSVLSSRSSTGSSFFGDRAAMVQLLEQEEQQHVASGNFEYVQHMELWKGSIGDTLREAASKKQLSDWLVSLAPMASHKLWREICLAYAVQLQNTGNYHKAASYYLACHKVEDAIDMLTTHKMFREALAIAKCRLMPDDPVIVKIIREWIHQLSSDGHYELAAECLLSFGELVEAAELLGRRNDESSLGLAVSIAKEAEAWILAASLARQCIHTSLLHKNWNLATSVVKDHGNLEHFNVLIVARETIHELNSEGGVHDTPLLQTITKKHEVNYGSPLGQFYDALERGTEKTLLPDSFDKLWLSVSEQVALACCSGMDCRQLRHIVTAAATCYQYQVLRPSIHPLYDFITWLAPSGLSYAQSLFVKQSDVLEEASLLRSLKAYFYAAFFHWVHDTEISQVPVNGIERVKGSIDWQQVVLPVLREYALTIENEADALQYFKDQVEIKKWEQEVASAMVKGRKEDEGKPVTDDIGLQKLEQLKIRKETFEGLRLSAPNPFITYCIFKNICLHMIKEEEIPVVEELLQKAENSWMKLDPSNHN